MTRATIRARALFQAGEQESALGNMVSVVNQYINEGLRAMCPQGVAETIGATVKQGSAELDGEVLDILRVRDGNGREYTDYQVRNGYVCGLPDGEYELLVLREAAPMNGDSSECELPEEAHGALADYAAWRLLSNGGRTQQIRGEFFRQRFAAEAARVQRQLEQRMGARRRINRYP